MALKKLSAIINQFLFKWLLIPASIFIIIFSLFWIYIEISEIKKLQQYFIKNINQHIALYLQNCKSDLEHISKHIRKNSDKGQIKDFIGPGRSLEAVYLLDNDWQVLRSVPQETFKKDFSGLIKPETADNKSFFTAPYYSHLSDKIVVGIITKKNSNRPLLAELNLKSLEEHIQNASQFLEHGFVFLTDSFGNLIAHSDMSLVKQQTNVGQLKIFSRMKNKETASGFFKNYDGLKLMSAENVREGNWKIILEQDVLSLCKWIIIAGILILTATLTFFSILVFMFNKKLNSYVVKPLSQFNKNIELLTKNSLSIKKNKVQKPFQFAELEALDTKFAEMEKTIKTREESLKQSDQILENSDHIAVFKDTQLRYVKVNKAYTKLTGIESVEGKTDAELFKGISSEKEILMYMENDNKAMLLSKGGVLAFEESVSWDGINRRTFLTKKFPVYNENNEILGTGTLSSDITEIKRSEEKLEAEKERLAVTLRSIGDGVITTDINGRVLLVNKVAEKLTGFSQSEAYQKLLPEIFNIIHEKTGKKHENPVEKVIKTGESAELANHTVLISKDGSEKIIEDSAAPIKDRNSSTIGAVLVFRDMTEKNRLRETIQKTAKLESLGVLAGGIAHDFNNLLGGIYGYIDLSREFSTQEKVREFLDKSLDTIERARNLTGQLLTFSKGGSPVKKVQPIDSFIKQAAEFALSGSTTKCFFNIQKDLSMSDFDKNQIEQVIENIVINAEQSMHYGGAIQISAVDTFIKEKDHPELTPGKYVKISVKDQGTGILPEIKDKIFDPFFTTKTTGHGIGLATCYSIIEKHNGIIEVESKPGKGSVFHIYLPAVNNVFSKNNKSKPEIHKGEGIVLVMDDEKVIRKMTAEMLESFGYNTAGVENGNLAVDYFKKSETKIKAMIFDLTIPGGMGGLEAVKKIREINSKIPVFVASGYSKDPVMNNPEKYGFTASIIKPFKISELAELFNKHLL